MKRKSKQQKSKKRKEFRFHSIEFIRNGKTKKIKHPTYIFLEKGNVYVYICITHSEKVKNTILIKLRRNPNPKDDRDSYRTTTAKEDTKDRFGRRKKNWKMDPDDDKEIRDEYKKDDSVDR